MNRLLWLMGEEGRRIAGESSRGGYKWLKWWRGKWDKLELDC